MAREFVSVDPASLHLPGSRRDGADPIKFQRQLARHGSSMVGMPPPEVMRGTDNELVIYDGVTRATRVLKYLPDTLIHGRDNGTTERTCGRFAYGWRKAMKKLQTMRSELLVALEELSRLKPEWRLGQMMANLATTAGRLDAGAVWDLEDTDALAAARTLIELHSETVA